MSTTVQIDQQKEIGQLKEEIKDAQKLIYKLWKKTFPDEPIDITYIWTELD